ncbi:hypothetical protein MA16_Dca006793 [Dendrobium catenatum]|uniref:Uncharacterized protein n=1 Tax=Dendrobium catenatum TaxID=906689 RepID=A0A2I0W969_9ASPA|nr:hypothetical protein MA16_Dca006793 [Dendrobium catenatum]
MRALEKKDLQQAKRRHEESYYADSLDPRESSRRRRRWMSDELPLPGWSLFVDRLGEMKEFAIYVVFNGIFELPVRIKEGRLENVDLSLRVVCKSVVDFRIGHP